MTRTYLSVTLTALAMTLASASFAGVPIGTTPGNNFDGTMSLIYNDLNGDVFIENSPHPNPSVQTLMIGSVNGLLLPDNLAVPPAHIVTATPNLIELNAPGNFYGTASYLGDILAPGYLEIQLLVNLQITYAPAASSTVNGDLIHGSFGQLQSQAVVPPAPCCRFFNVATGQFFDPPLAGGYVYSMDDLSLFTKVGFPLGLGDDFTITSSEGTVSGLTEGSEHVFSGGVSTFTLTGITPPVDPSNPAAFPLYLEFNTPTASFTMTPVLVPEPSALALVVIASVTIFRRRQR
jgi:hypothetical protein